MIEIKNLNLIWFNLDKTAINKKSVRKCFKRNILKMVII